MGRRSDRRVYDERYEGERRGGSSYPDEQYEESDPHAPGTGTRRKKKGGFGSFLTTLLLVIAIGVFGYSAYKLYGYWREYRAGENEYSDLNKKYVQIEPAPETAPDSQTKAESGEKDEGVILSDVRELETEATLPQKIEEAKKEEVEENGTTQSLPEMYNPVDFRELQSINPEVIGWIRVGGAGISYPVAQTDNNDFYLQKVLGGQGRGGQPLFLGVHTRLHLSVPDFLQLDCEQDRGSVPDKISDGGFPVLHRYMQEGIGSELGRRPCHDA